MEQKLNITEILKDKSIGIKLYSSTFGYIKFNGFIYHIKYFTGNKYLVTGDLLDETGTDGEPLIKNVKILKKL